MIVHGVREGEYADDEDVLNELAALRAATGISKHLGIVQIVADDYFSWNILKDHLLVHPEHFGAQLRANENALRANPKSYQAWHHRQFMMARFPAQREACRAREDILTSLLLKADPRNFHCWKYRMHMFAGEDGSCRDLFNYSYLHYHPEHDPLPIVYTDPMDAAGWEYLRVCRETARLRAGAYIRRYPRCIEVRFRENFRGVLTLRTCGDERTIRQDLDTRIVSVEGTFDVGGCWIWMNGRELELVAASEDLGFAAEILDIEPRCHHALLLVLEHAERGRAEMIRRLAELDPVRRRYYASLSNQFYTTHTAR